MTLCLISPIKTTPGRSIQSFIISLSMTGSSLSMCRFYRRTTSGSRSHHCASVALMLFNKHRRLDYLIPYTMQRRQSRLEVAPISHLLNSSLNPRSPEWRKRSESVKSPKTYQQNCGLRPSITWSPEIFSP